MGDPPDKPAAQPDVPRIDRPILEDIRDRLRTTATFETVVIESTGQTRLHAVVDPQLNPADLDDRFLDVRCYTNDDFRFHYQETWTDHTCQQRWDRHQSDHNTRDHLHPAPDAATPGTDRSWSRHYRDVMAQVLSAIADRNDELWRDGNASTVGSIRWCRKGSTGARRHRGPSAGWMRRCLSAIFFDHHAPIRGPAWAGRRWQPTPRAASYSIRM